MNNLTETITWIPVGERMPEPDTTVLMFMPSADGEPIWLGYHDSASLEWRSVDGVPVDAVTHWANVPAGPGQTAPAPHGAAADAKTRMFNIATCIMRSTLVVREWNGKGRPKVYRDGIDAIAGAARQLAEYAIEHAGATVTTGIFLQTWQGTWQPNLCVCCGKPVTDRAPMFLIDRDTCEVLPDQPQFCERGRYWPVGSECLKRYPGIERYAICPPSEPAGPGGGK